jgi:hypothetical protein
VESSWVHSARWPLIGLLYLPGSLWWWRIWWNEDWQGKPKYSEKTRPSATLSTTNPTWPDPGSATLSALRLCKEVTQTIIMLHIMTRPKWCFGCLLYYRLQLEQHSSTSSIGGDDNNDTGWDRTWNNFIWKIKALEKSVRTTQISHYDEVPHKFRALACGLKY